MEAPLTRRAILFHLLQFLSSRQTLNRLFFRSHPKNSTQMLSRNKQPLSSRFRRPKSIRKVNSSQTQCRCQDHVTTKATRKPTSSLSSTTNLSTREAINKQTITKTIIVNMVHNNFNHNVSTTQPVQCLNKKHKTLTTRRQANRPWISQQTLSAAPATLLPAQTLSPRAKSNLISSLLTISSHLKRVARERLISQQRLPSLNLNQALNLSPQTQLRQSLLRFRSRRLNQLSQ